MPIYRKRILMPLPLDLVSPTSWQASWDETDGLVFEEWFAPEVLDEAPGAVQTTVELSNLISVSAEVAPSNNGVKIQVPDPKDGLLAMFTELLGQMEVRGVIAPGALLRITAILMDEVKAATVIEMGFGMRPP